MPQILGLPENLLTKMSSATSGVNPDRIICAVRHASSAAKHHMPINPSTNSEHYRRSALEDRHLKQPDKYSKINQSLYGLAVICGSESRTDHRKKRQRSQAMCVFSQTARDSSCFAVAEDRRPERCSPGNTETP